MMSLSSFSVVMNALRLNLWKPKKKCPEGDPCKENSQINDIKTVETEEKNDMNVIINVQGMMCPHCEARVKKVCEAIDGVISATPSYKSGTVELVMKCDLVEECKKAIVDAGYDV